MTVRRKNGTRKFRRTREEKTWDEIIKNSDILLDKYRKGPVTPERMALVHTLVVLQALMIP